MTLHSSDFNWKIWIFTYQFKLSELDYPRFDQVPILSLSLVTIIQKYLTNVQKMI